MGFVTGTSSCSPQHSPIFSTSPSQCWPQQPFLIPFRRNASHRKKRRVMASLQQEDQKDGNLCNRRVILFVGVAASVMPLLNMRSAEAFQPAGELGTWVFVFLFDWLFLLLWSNSHCLLCCFKGLKVSANWYWLFVDVWLFSVFSCSLVMAW